MNRFSRIRHHVDIKDVKRKHLEESSAKKLEEKRLKEDAEQIRAEYEKYKVDWRNELDEGMTVGGFMLTTLPSEGDEALVNNDTKNVNDGTVPYPLNPPDANALPGVSDIFAPGPANVIDPNGKGDNEGVPYGTASGGGFGGGAIWASSTEPDGSRDAGTIENAGFDMGGPYARLYSIVGGPVYGTIPYRYLTLASTDTTELSHLRITAIQGNNQPSATGNGGMGGWDINGAKEQASIRVRYWVPGMSDFQYLSVNPQGQTTRGQFGQDQLNPTDVIVPYDANASTPTNFSIELPKYARGKDVRFQLYQKATVQYNINHGQHWGVSNISYQRRTPISVFVSLDDPEATSFVRVGQGTKKSSPQKRKKRVNDILSASKEYANKYLGSDFPGSSTELSPETSPEVSSVDQEIADVQQQKRDSMSQQTKDRFDGDQPETMNNEPKVPDFTKFNNSKDLEDAYQATYQQYQKDLEAALKNYGRETYRMQLKGSQSNWDNFQKNRPEGSRSSRPTFDAGKSNSYATSAVNGTLRISYDTPAGKAIKAIIDAQNEKLFAYVDAQDQLRKRSQKDKGVNPQAEPVKDEGGEDKLDNDLSSKDMDNYLDSLPPSVRDDLLNGRALPDYTLDTLLFSLLPQTRVVSTAVNKINMAARALDKWWNKGRNVRVKDESTADWRTLMLDDLAQRGQSDAAFKAGKTPRGIGRPDQAFNPFRPGSKGGPGSGPTPAVRQAFERFFKLGLSKANQKSTQKGSKSVYKKKREALSLDEPIVTSPRSSKKSKKKNKEG